MRSLLSACLAMVLSCSDSAWPGVWVDGDPFAECTVPVTEDCRASGQTFALAVCADLTADNTLQVSGSEADVALWVGGSSTTRAPLRVTGDYWAASNTATNTQTISGAIGKGVPPACTRVIRTDGRAGYDVKIDEPASVNLGGCTYAQPNLQVDNTLDVHIRDSVVWVIEGSLRIAAPLVIEVDPGASLTWVIGGALEIDNTLTIAGPTTLSVGGSIHVAAPFKLDGSLIAPQSRVEADNTVDITGAAYVGSLRVAAPMHVDGSTLLSESGCAPLDQRPLPR